ncbi:MAG TPA: hypoxanthine phosphoribosyltransferase [Rhodothermales bacterium]|nr:hypoxanthine phosphoribosyltransferase [Bacteroidota bacterium]HRK75113.1 hypoxanthine phosphoribosyltransferase [Rhodothermales bacterium]HRR10174.1 hypoxanthine phosphoribosyltransferase [Rhodothermales bacterium]
MHFAPSETPEIVYCRDERFRLMIPNETLQTRITEIGSAINEEYDGKNPIFIGLLNGSFIFMADLIRNVTIDCEMDFIKLSSYGAEKISSGQVTEKKGLDAKIAGRHVIVVEDIVDTGLSMRYILEQMAHHQPASVKVVTLLHKPDATRENVQLDWVGFSIENKFVLGYGLDYGQLGRNLAAIYVLDEVS